MLHVIPHPLLAVTLFCRRGRHHITMEPSLRFHRTQTRYSQRHTRTSGDDLAVWFVANILGASSEVMFLMESRLRATHPFLNSRFLAGALNGNVGVMKSMLAEMGDKTNMSRIFAIGPLSWTIGAALGYVSLLLADWLSDR